MSTQHYLIVKLLRLQERKGWTQAQLAKKLRTRQATISDWSTGKQSPGGFARATIAAFISRNSS